MRCLNSVWKLMITLMDEDKTTTANVMCSANEFFKTYALFHMVTVIEYYL